MATDINHVSFYVCGIHFHPSSLSLFKEEEIKSYTDRKKYTKNDK